MQAIEQKALAVREQHGEFERIRAAYEHISVNFEQLTADKRRLEALMAQAEAQARRDARERR